MAPRVLFVVLLGLLLLAGGASASHRHHRRLRHIEAARDAVDAGPTASVTIDANKPQFTVSPLLWGAFYEELNHAGYGSGLYADLLENGLFQQNATAPWTGSSGCTLVLDPTDPLTPNNTNSLLLKTSGACTLVNAGYFGIAVKPATLYNVSFFAKAPARHGLHARHAHRADPNAVTVTVGLQSKSGTVYAQATVAVSGATWTQYFTQIAVPSSVTLDPTGEFFLTVPSTTTLSLHVVRLMEAAGWNGLPLRTDLAQMIADIHPGVLRFPGGCYVEGHQRVGAWRWKTTIGPVQERPGHPGFWGYWSPDHLGAFELLSFSELIGAEPVFVVNAGMSYEGDDVPLAEMGEFVQDALDIIEFCNGDTTSKWGAVRASLGHPTPFNLKYMAIGNEEDKLMADYAQRYPLFYNAIKAAYPKFNVISTTPRVTSSYGLPFDLYDYHLYSNPVSVANAMTTFNNANRSQLVFASEFAVSGGSNDTANYYTLVAALAEAQYMIGLEHNSDVVMMGAYAPLFVNYYDQNWSPDAIMFNTYQVFGSPSYYQQVLYGSNAGCTLLPSAVPATAGITVNSAFSGVTTKLAVSATSRPIQATPGGHAVCTGGSATGPQELVVKMVYWGTADIAVTFNVTLPSSSLTLQKSVSYEYLGNSWLWTANTLAAPHTIVPVQSTASIAPTVTAGVASFTFTVAAQSSSVLILTLN